MPPDPPRDPDRRLELRIVIPSEPLAVRAALGSVMAGLDVLGPSEDARGTVELTLAEALNNVVEHAYGGGAGLIEMVLAHARGRIAVEVSDDGRPLPGGLDGLPFAPDPHELPEGGFGWAILAALARDLDYRRAGGRNHLRFVVELAEGAPVRAA